MPERRSGPGGEATVLECRGLSVSYGHHRALEGVAIRIEREEIVVILGANGAGKTTLLKAIAGIVPAAGSSQIVLDGHPVTNRPPHRIVEAGLALVPEGRGIFADLSVRENLLLGAYAHRARAAQRENLDRVLTLFPRLAERSHQIARTMSGGEQQMVAIGRALMSAPKILMLDEPSLGLSPLLCGELFRALVAIRRTGVGILLVEQNARQGLAIADRAYLLENGHIVGEGSAAALASDPAVQRAYLGVGGEAAQAQRTPASAAAAARAPAMAAVTQAAAGAQAAPGAQAAVTAQAAPGTHAAVDARAAAGAGAWPPREDAARRAGDDALRAALGARAPAGGNLRAEALIPQSIQELVSRAASIQAEHVKASRTGAMHAGSGVSVRGVPGGSLGDALAAIEAAAAQARKPPASPGAAGAHAGAPAQAPAGAAADALPAIEVYRRPKLEIYRRSGDGGTLERVNGG